MDKVETYVRVSNHKNHEFSKQKQIKKLKAYCDEAGYGDEMNNLKTRYFLNDDNLNIIIKYVAPSTIYVFRKNDTEWAMLPPDNSYIREINAGQGNNCMTETTEQNINEIINRWLIK